MLVHIEFEYSDGISTNMIASMDIEALLATKKDEELCSRPFLSVDYFNVTMLFRVITAKAGIIKKFCGYNPKKY